MPHLPCPCFCEECKRDRQASSHSRTEQNLSISDEEYCYECGSCGQNMKEEESREEHFDDDEADSLNQEEDLILEVVLHGITPSEADQSSESLSLFEEENRFSNENQLNHNYHKSEEEKLYNAQKIVCAKWEKLRKPTIKTRAYEKSLGSDGRSKNLIRNNLDILKNGLPSENAKKEQFQKGAPKSRSHEVVEETKSTMVVEETKSPKAVEETKSNKAVEETKSTQKTININLNFND